MADKFERAVRDSIERHQVITEALRKAEASDAPTHADSIPAHAASLAREHLIHQIGRVIQSEFLGGNDNGGVSVLARRTAQRIVDGPLAAFAVESSFRWPPPPMPIRTRNCGRRSAMPDEFERLRIARDSFKDLAAENAIAADRYAGEVSALRARIGELERALKPFAKALSENGIRGADLRAARSALSRPIPTTQTEEDQP